MKRMLGTLLLLGLGFAIGWLVRPAGTATAPATDAQPPAGATIWTCSMHPQVRLPRPGRCPICGMELVPAAGGAAASGPVRLGPGAQAISSIEVAAIEERALERELRTVGRIETAEPLVAYLTARADGRVERVFADYTGIEVRAGDHLLDLYAPDLVVAQEEFLIAARNLQGAPSAPGSDAAAAAWRLQMKLARQKLRLLGVTESQLAKLEETGEAQVVLTVFAPMGGTVLEKSARAQEYVKAGDPLYTIADLSTVWLFADVYEFDLPWIARGQEAIVEVEGVPGETYSGTVAFVDPVVSDETRTVKVRMNIPNPDGRLRPGMFARATIRARLGPDGRRAESRLPGDWYCRMHPEVRGDASGTCRICGMDFVEEKPRPAPAGAYWTCTMHPEVRRDGPGTCPICGMALVEKTDAEKTALLAVPVSAVLDTGARRIVYVERQPGEYELRAVTLGPRAGDFYPVLAGLAKGEKVVVRGNFLVDSQSQIEGRPSLLFPEGVAGAGGSPPAGHEGHR